MIGKILDKIRQLGQPSCPNCDTVLVTYRPKKVGFKNFVEFRYQCPNCHKAFLQPSWVMWLFFILFTLFYFTIRSPLGETFFLTLFDPLIELIKADKISVHSFIWGMGIAVIVFTVFIGYLIIMLGSSFVKNQLVEILPSELTDWKIFRRNTGKEIINDLKAIKNFPLWQKIIAILFTLLVLGLVIFSYSFAR